MAIAQFLPMRAISPLQVQQQVLREVAQVPWVSGLAVRLLWVPTVFQPRDTMSHIESDENGSWHRAEVVAWYMWVPLLNHPQVVKL